MGEGERGHVRENRREGREGEGERDGGGREGEREGERESDTVEKRKSCQEKGSEGQTCRGERDKVGEANSMKDNIEWQQLAQRASPVTKRDRYLSSLGQGAHIFHLMVVCKQLLQFLSPVVAPAEQAHAVVVRAAHVAEPRLSRLHPVCLCSTAELLDAGGTVDPARGVGGEGEEGREEGGEGDKRRGEERREEEGRGEERGGGERGRETIRGGGRRMEQWREGKWISSETHFAQLSASHIKTFSPSEQIQQYICRHRHRHRHRHTDGNTQSQVHMQVGE